MGRSITSLMAAAALLYACSFDWARYEPMSSGSDGAGAAGGAGGSEASAGSTADGGTTASVTSGGNGGGGGSSSNSGSGGSGGAVMPLCTVSFSDDFQDGIAAPQWSIEQAGIVAEEVGGVLELDIPAGPSGNAGYALAQTTSLTDGYASMRVPMAPGVGDDGYLALRAYEAGSAAFVQIVKGGDNLLVLEKYDGVMYTAFASVTYNDTSMAWWRLRNEAGMTHMDTSSDGVSWISKGSVMDTEHLSLEAVYVRIRFHARGDTPLDLHVDDFALCD